MVTNEITNLQRHFMRRVHEKSIIFSTDVKPGRDDWFNLRNSYTVYLQQTYFRKYEERLFR